ncbi:hypothetical protein EDB81DRAFT_775542 [Dactylonectria macrodidyma]|uniref:Uncharacterized protein n=1 Tax=Dactylonectria macrodidyma TaxID=307937 RepID=A0A9P9FP07_9HYPO|nr:hypothetical protein EDB81DRAFT_775542 [Dactylonectria macrodidyma]
MAPPRTRKRKSGQDLPADKSVDSAAPEESRRQKMLPVRAKDGDAPVAASTPAQGSMKVFTDEDNAAPVSVSVSQPASPTPEGNEEKDDSDDEAPEAVSTTKVASDIKKSARVAQKAVREQAAEQKRKRQQRDTLLKQQAEERKKAEEEAKAVEDAAPAEQLVRKRHAPKLLPAEFLTDSSSEDEADDDRLIATNPPKRRKIATVEKSLTRESRGPRDERVGSTVYRVAKKVDERIAPRLAKYTKSSKDLLLKRNRTAVRPQRAGRLVKR